MKRLFTFAIIGMIASLTFAQTQIATKKAPHQITKELSTADLTKKMNDAKTAQLAIADKATATQTTSKSVFRHAKTAVTGMPVCVGGTQLPGFNFNVRAIMGVSSTMQKAAPMKTVVVEGNVTITKDDNGIITDVTGVEPTYYQRSKTGTAYYNSGGNVYFDAQSGVATLIIDGDNVYFKNPISRYEMNSWVKGVKNGNTITVAAGQPLAYDLNYDATISLRWGLITSEGAIKAADDHADAFTFTIDGDVITLEGTQAIDPEDMQDSYFMGAFWDDDNTSNGYGDAETVLTLDNEYVAPSTELVVLPEGATVDDWYMNAVSYSDNSKIKNASVKVAFVGDDVYVAGISETFAGSWVKGTVDGETIKFDNFQYIGDYSTYTIWFVGFDFSVGDLCTPTAAYDAAAKTITFNEAIASNAADNRLYYLECYLDAVLSADAKTFEEPIITDLTAELPYNNTFESPEEIDQVAIYDANDDGSTFTITDGGDGYAACYSWNSVNAADDYLVFPGLPLKAGESYCVALDVREQSTYYTESFEILAGTVAKASAFDITVVPAMDVDFTEFQAITNDDFTVEEDGIYYFAVHCTSAADQYKIYFDNFSIKVNDPAAPLAVADLEVAPDESGDNEATVTFTVPATTVGGTDINGKLDVKVTRNGETILEAKKVAGKKVTLIDEVDAPGFYSYNVSVADGSHISDDVTVKAYIGIDTPTGVTNLKATDLSTSVELSWDAPTTGVNGGVVVPSELTYNIYPVEMVELWGMLFPSTDYEHPYWTGLMDTCGNVEFNTNEGPQQNSYFAVSAESVAGEGLDMYAVLLTGAPYELPIFEGVANATMATDWYLTMDDVNYNGDGNGYVADESSDGDGYSIMLTAGDPGWISLQTGKITCGGATNPVVSFDALTNEDATVDVVVLSAKGEEIIGSFTPGAEFTHFSASLIPYANDPWIRVTFKANFAEAGDVYIDNIKIYNELDNNLVAGAISAPSKVNAGDPIAVSVVVENQGALAAEGYTVDLYANGEKVQSAEGEALASGAKTSVAFKVETNTLSPEAIAFKAVVVYAADEDDTNNTTATVTTKIKLPNFPIVEDLAIDGKTLTWSEPNLDAAAPEEVTDDFEDYDPFEINNAGVWTFVDVDGSVTYGFNGIQFPNAGSAMSFIVFDSSITESLNGFALSGNQAMACFAAMDGANDDWMISPVLFGGAQTVTFNARAWLVDYGCEEFEFLYSTTDTELSSFIKLDEKHDVVEDWTEYSYNLPEGAKYFAIRCISNDRFIFIVDDVTYIPAAEGADLDLVGYNVYRNGEKINEAPITETTYTDADAKADDVYVVTVVYAQGESAPSNQVAFTTALNSVVAGSAINVVGRTIVVKSTEGNVEVYTTDGKAIYNAAANNNVITVTPGVYVVKNGKLVTKVVVK